MADIANELNNILNATYGEEVRNSIYDAISKINTYTETAANDMNDHQKIIDQAVVDFYAWFRSLSVILEGDVATNLAVEIVKLNNNFSTLVANQCIYQTVQDSDGNNIEDSFDTPMEGKIVYKLA